MQAVRDMGKKKKKTSSGDGGDADDGTYGGRRLEVHDVLPSFS